MLNNINRNENIKADHITIENSEATFLHIMMMIACIFIYIFLNFVVIQLSSLVEDYSFVFYGARMNRYTICAILAQVQVISIILITLNPIRKSNIIALLLCTVTGGAAIFSVLMSGHMDALPGFVIPFISGGISLIISSYSRNLKKQMSTILNYGKIVKSKEELLHKLAYYDTLTGLPNRKMMMDRIDQMTDPMNSQKNEFTLVYMDLDNFKKINDTMGHKTGDEILEQIALRWKEKCQKEDIMGRIGGDEFLFIIPHKTESLELDAYLNNLKLALASPLVIDRKEFLISASCGITRYPEDGKNAQELLKNADIALYRAKNMGKNDFQVFCKEMQDEVMKKIQLENGLLSAIQNNEFTMMFQPQYLSATKELRGFEALIRWTHPEMGKISPTEFIPIAEETGVIIDIGRWIIETVLSKFIEFEKRWNIKTMVSINLSVVQLLDPSFVDMVREILRKTGYKSKNLEFEITESVLISSPEHVINVIKKLKKLGIKFALDDFGTGYTSLNYLQLLPINTLKIDKSFIDGIRSKSSVNKMVGAIITLSHQLGIEVVAEGVERKEQLQYLIKQRCDYIQGYYLGRPLAEEQMVDLYERTG